LFAEKAAVEDDIGKNGVFSIFRMQEKGLEKMKKVRRCVDTTMVGISLGAK
jgi:hypothetical protein